MTATQTFASTDEAPLYQHRWLAMTILLIANFMNMIDVTIVNVALPSLQSSLSASESAIEWVVAGYILAFALGLLPFGRYGDIVGRKKIFLIGVGCFTLASAFCGFAVNIEMLIVSRIVQGVAGAVMTPQILAIAQVMFPPKERAAAFSLFGLTAGLASVAGPITGGLLIDNNILGLEWRPIFLINVPIGIITILAGRALIPDMKGNPALKNDFIGIFIAGLAIFSLIFPLIEGRGFGWPLWCFAMMALSLPFTLAFVTWQRHQKAKGGPELMPVSLMTNANYMFGTLTTMVFFSALPGFFLIISVFLQFGYKLSPLDAGLTTLPFPVGVLLSSAISGRLGGRWLRPRIVAGAVILLIGIVLMRYTVENTGELIVRSAFMLPMVLCGLGTGVTIAPLFQIVLMKVPGRDAGSGSGALQAIQQVGAALGVAIISQIFFSEIPAAMMKGASQHDAFKSAFIMALWYNIAVYVVVAFAVLLLKTAPTQAAPQAVPIGD